jgi:undecaprenyl-diphosphatase
MNLNIILLALIQGTTEWLPISSSGHIILIEQLFAMNTPTYYNILLHFATLLVILIVFYKEIIQITKATLTLNFKNKNGKMGLYLILATLPIALIGYFFNDTILHLFSNITIIAIAFIATGILLLLTKKRKGKKKLTTKSTIIIGIFQAIALIPGISRSGTTISSALLLGINKKDITTFSFLLAIPAILGATILQYTPGAITIDMIIGMGIATITGYLTLKILIKMINQNRFYLFGYYCIVLGTLVLIF